jgi:hypothetical protein
MKYTKEVKTQAVEAVKKGLSFKEIQTTIGPNPKAVQRYLVAAGVDYAKLKEELKAKGLLKPAMRKQGEAPKVEAPKKA